MSIRDDARTMAIVAGARRRNADERISFMKPRAYASSRAGERRRERGGGGGEGREERCAKRARVERVHQEERAVTVERSI